MFKFEVRLSLVLYPAEVKGISSAFPLPLGSCSLNAVSTLYQSSKVFGVSRPSLFSQSVRIWGPTMILMASSVVKEVIMYCLLSLVVTSFKALGYWERSAL